MELLKAIVSVLLLASFATARNAKSTRGQEIIGPIEWDCPQNGVFPDPDNCDQFIECWDNNTNLWRCTDLMLFDLNYNGCNYAQYVHCEERPRPTNVPSTMHPPTSPTPTSNVTTTTTPRPPEDFVCPGDGVFAHEERCEYYWQCWAGTAELIHCQGDLLYDRVYDGCNFPDMTDCDHRERPGGSSNPTTRFPPTTTQAPETGPTTTADPNATTLTPPETTTRRGGNFQCPPSIDGDFADPDDCSSFYTCVGGIPYHFHCQPGLYFDPISNACNYPNLVDCGTRPIP